MKGGQRPGFGLKWGSSLSVEVITKTTWVTVRARVTPSFRVRVWFRAILFCLILKRVLVVHGYIH